MYAEQNEAQTMRRKRRTQLWRFCGDVRSRHAEHYDEESLLAHAGMYREGTVCTYVERACENTFMTTYPEQDDVLLLVRCRRTKRHACAFRFCAFLGRGGIVDVYCVYNFARLELRTRGRE